MPMNTVKADEVYETINAGLTAALRARHIIGRRVSQ